MQDEARALPESPRPAWHRVLVALLVINALLVVPEWWMPYGGFLAPVLAPEALVAVGGLLLAPARLARLLALPATLIVLTAVGLALSDLATGWALGRPVNVYIDFPLLASVEHLLRGAIGAPLAWAVLLGALGLLVVLTWRLVRGLGALRGAAGNGWRATVTGLLLLVAGMLLWQSRDVPALAKAVDTPLAIRLSDQAERLALTAQAYRHFPEMLRALPATPVDPDRLDGRDVILAFIESYGVTLTNNPGYRTTGLAALDAMQASLAAAGLSVVTGHFDSPVQGGQSWLAHGTVLSGLWLDDQIRYDLYLAEDPPSLIDDFAAAGYTTAAIMPAITDPWPAGRQWGYDQVHDHARIDYAGPALNWVTMPDQYTWHYFQEQVRAPAERPLFAELALISSHAPWTPIIDIVAWDQLGRGEVFARWGDAGPSPGAVWSDRERVRRHYVRAVDYALRTAGQWAARSLDDGVLILLGDHQPAPLITGEEASRAVPVHVISADAGLLADFRRQGFRAGVLGGPESLGSLADLRGQLHAVFDGGQAPR